MSNLKSSVRNSIAVYVHQQADFHTHADVLRVIRDQATLLYERQLICDELDADPMEQLDGVRRQINRIKKLLDVTSCSRVLTVDGYSSIDAVLELRRDEHMDKEVSSNVQLTFHYERRQSREEDYDNNGAGMRLPPRRSDSSSGGRGTHVAYWIDVSCDYGEKQRLMIIEVWAVGEGPSMETAQLWGGDDNMDEEEEADVVNDDNGTEIEGEYGKSKSQAMDQDAEDAKIKDDEPVCDRFAAYIDPDTLSNFLQWTNLDDMDIGTTIFFLMTFPFYEHEWDLVGFLLQAVFGEDDESGSEEIIEEEIMSEEEDGGSQIMAGDE